MPDRGADDAYARFLVSCDLTSWRESLKTLASGSDGADIVRSLIVSIYVRWLAWLAGNSPAGDEADRTYDALTKRLLDAHRRESSAETQAGLGIVLSMMGYRVSGKGYLNDRHLAAPEIALLFEPSDPGHVTATLQRFVTSDARSLFRPVLYRYCDSLLDLGAVNEVQKLISSHRGAVDGMMIDIVGRGHEQAGHWTEAAETYRQSSWPRHAYRAAICEAIAGRMTRDRPSQRPSGQLSDTPPRELALQSTEIDQGELARTTAFINACRWRSFDDWLIHYELGQLAFRRRRYIEAESHLAQAAASAPRGRRYPILSLRFSNLTWLSDDTSAHGVPMEPEALLAARMALECSMDPSELPESDAANVRLWLADQTGMNALLEPLLDTPSDYYRGHALRQRGDAPGSIDSWLKCLTSGHQPRATFNVIVRCYVNELFRSGAYLVDLITTEGSDDFFVLWELGIQLQSIVGTFDRASDAYETFERARARIAARIEELSQYDFQHLLRAYSFFRDADEHHIAEAVLTRAAKFADGAEENLAIAVARRVTAETVGQERDRQGLACLLRADAESGDRLERLLIAREMFHYGQPSHARGILRDLGVIDQRSDLTLHLSHVEFVVALQCAPWLGRAEMMRLSESAFARLEQDVASGRLHGVVRKFTRRLWTVVFLADEILGQSSWERLSIMEESDTEEIAGRVDETSPASAGAAAAPPPTQWAEWQKALLEADKAGHVDLTERMIADALTVGATAGVGFNIALYETIRGRIRTWIDNAATARPDVGEHLTPVSKSKNMLNRRTQEMCDLWRRQLRDQDNSPMLEEFFATEERLLESWDKARLELARQAMMRASFWFDCADKAAALLEMTCRNVAVHHPQFTKFYDALAQDAADVRSRFVARRAIVAAEPMVAVAADVRE